MIFSCDLGSFLGDLGNLFECFDRFGFGSLLAVVSGEAGFSFPTPLEESRVRAAWAPLINSIILSYRAVPLSGDFSNLMPGACLFLNAVIAKLSKAACCFFSETYLGDPSGFLWYVDGTRRPGGERLPFLFFCVAGDGRIFFLSYILFACMCAELCS